MTYVMVAPNGARKTKLDHAAIPVTDAEVIEAAIQCQAAGADAIHIHIRDAAQQHLLDHQRYQSIVSALQQKAPDLGLQVTSEAAGIYQATAQMKVLDALEVPWVSVSIREILRVEDRSHMVSFLHRLLARCRVQFILYDAVDFESLHELQCDQVLPERLEVLYVLGRYATNQVSSTKDLDPFLRFRDSLPSAQRPLSEMVCAFGHTQIECLVEAAAQGLDVRVGFENGWWLHDGRIAADNAELVVDLCNQLHRS